MQPGQQEGGTDEGLEQQPQVGEPMLPTRILDPGRMVIGGARRRGGRGRQGRRLLDGRCSGQGGRLQTHQIPLAK